MVVWLKIWQWHWHREDGNANKVKGDKINGMKEEATRDIIEHICVWMCLEMNVLIFSFMHIIWSSWFGIFFFYYARCLIRIGTNVDDYKLFSLIVAWRMENLGSWSVRSQLLSRKHKCVVGFGVVAIMLVCAYLCVCEFKD